MLPDTTQIPFDDMMLESCRGVGSTFVCNGTRHLKFLEDCGFVEKDSLDVTYYGQDGIDRLLNPRDYVANNLYEYRVVRAVPDHLIFS